MKSTRRAGRIGVRRTIEKGGAQGRRIPILQTTKKQAIPKKPSGQATDFARVVDLIQSARGQAYRAVNTALIELYWRVGEFISRRIAAAEWGEGVLHQLTAYIATSQPALRGFTPPNLFRMRQFYKTYCLEPTVSPLVRLLPWTHNLIILGQSQRGEEREFYLRLAFQENGANANSSASSRPACSSVR